MKKEISLLLLFICYLFFPVAIYADDTATFIISEIVAESEKKTNPLAIKMEMDIKEGDSFFGKESLERAINSQIAALMSSRLFDEVNIIYDILDESEDGVTVKLYVYVEETLSIVILPYPKYDTNDGLLLSLRFRDYNFLGTMEKLSFNLNYEYDNTDTDEHSFSAEIAYAYNFEIRNQVITAQLTQGVTAIKVVEDNPDSNPDNFYLNTDFDISTNFRTNLYAFDIYPVKYYIELFNDVKYNLDPKVELPEDDQTWYIGGTHGFKFGDVSWVDNYRTGFQFSLLNTIKHNLRKTDYDVYTEPGDHWRTNFKLEFTYYKDFYPACYSGRTITLYQWQYYSNNGSYLRGIRDDYISSKGGLFFNNDILLTMLNVGKLFEIQAGAMLDLGIPFGYEDDSPFKDQLYWAAGIEVVVYPLFAKSFFIRGSLGYNVQEVWEERTLADDNYEVTFGLGHFF